MRNCSDMWLEMAASVGAGEFRWNSTGGTRNYQWFIMHFLFMDGCAFAIKYLAFNRYDVRVYQYMWCYLPRLQPGHFWYFWSIRMVKWKYCVWVNPIWNETLRFRVLFVEMRQLPSGVLSLKSYLYFYKTDLIWKILSRLLLHVHFMRTLYINDI